MDITLLRTFIEVTNSGSFAAAAENLFITQSAVSLRIQRLEEELGQPMFSRSKSGAELTAAGKEFERFALGHIKLWEEAKQQVAIPDGYKKSVVIGADHSLWPRLGFRWLDTIKSNMPTVSIRTEVGMPERLTRFLIEGIIQTALMYTPQLRPGIRAEKVMEDELVMVSSKPDVDLLSIKDDYIFVDWGPEFVHAHAVNLPHLTNPGLAFALGSMTIGFILNRPYSAYLPARSVHEHIDNQRLFLVADAPRFPYPIFHVWREDLDEEITAVARNTISRLAKGIEVRQDEIIEQLSEISEQDEVSILGE